MKKSIITVFAVIALASCGGNGQQAQQLSAANEGDKSVTVEFINNKVKDVVKYVPDHMLFENSEKFITPEFYALLKTAYGLPPQDTEGIDEASEFLFYFIEGNGECGAWSEANDSDREAFYKQHSFGNFKTTINGDVATSEFDYIHGVPSQTSRHTIVLKKVNGNWLIDDWDNAKKKVKEYIDNYKK